MSNDEKIAYGGVLLQAAAKGSEGEYEMHCVFLGNEGKKLKERIRMVKESEKRNIRQRAVAATIICAVCIAGVALGSLQPGASEKFAYAQGELEADIDLCEIGEAADRWAMCYASRDGSIRYNLLSKEKQKVFFEKDQTVVSDKELFDEKGFISIRGSSPWVESYSIENPGDGAVKIHYLMTDSTQEVYLMWETLVFGKEEGRLAVVDYETSELECFLSDEEFFDRIGPGAKVVNLDPTALLFTVKAAKDEPTPGLYRKNPYFAME